MARTFREIFQILCLACLLAVLWKVISGSTCPPGPDPMHDEIMAQITVEQEIKLALMKYRLEKGSYPDSEKAFHEAVVEYYKDASRKTHKRLIFEDQLIDPWRNPYRYEFPGSKNINGSRSYDVWSLGPDGVPSDDDIGNWKERSYKSE